MSSADKPRVIDNTEQEKISGEAVMILAIVLGFFLMILIVLCMLRYRESVKTKLLSPPSSIKGSLSRDKSSRSTFRPDLEALSTTEGSLELICDRRVLPRQVDSASYIPYSQNSSKYYQWEIPDSPQRKSQQLDYSAIPIDGRSSIIYPREKIFYSEYELPYDESSRSTSDESDLSTSVEKMEDYGTNRMQENHSERKLYNRYNYRPEGLSGRKYPMSESQIASNSISLSDINVRNPGGRSNPNKWQFLGGDTSSTSSSITAEELSPHHKMGNRLKGHRTFVTGDVYTETQINREPRNPNRIVIPSRSADNRETVEIAVQTPLFESAGSTSSSSDITERQFADKKRDVWRNPENQRSHPHNVAMDYRNQDAGTAHGYGMEDEKGQRQVYAGEKPRILTSGGVQDVSSPTWLVSEEDTSTIIRGHRQGHKEYRGSIEFSTETQ